MGFLDTLQLLLLLLLLLYILRGVLEFFLYVSRSGQITLIRRSLSDLPPVVVPNGYRLRPFRLGDEESWFRLVNAAFARDKWMLVREDRRSFERGPFAHIPEEQRLILFAEREVDGELVGTATASEGECGGRVIGMVGWMAVHPNHRGHGLGAALLTAALHAMHERGHTEAFLYTWPALSAAIRLYQRLGFEALDWIGAIRLMLRRWGARDKQHRRRAPSV